MDKSSTPQHLCDLLRDARAYVASYSLAPGCSTRANDLLLEIDTALLNAAPQEGEYPPAGPATKYGEPAVAASLLSERVPTEIEPRICLAAGCDRQCELGRLFCSSHRAHSSSAISNAAPQGADRVTAGVATSEPAGAFSPDKQERVPICGTVGLTVSRAIWDEAWIAYAKEYGNSESQRKRLLREGFYANELDHFRPGWRPVDQRIVELETTLSATLSILKENKVNIQQIARVAHEINRAYCQALGDTSQPRWEDAPAWQRESAINGVQFHIANPDAGPDHSHAEWLKEKEATGWKYGPVKNPDTKEHPCFVPYEQLPVEQKAKDYLFRAVVHALAIDAATS